MLYELIGIVRPGNVNEVKEIAKAAATTVLEAGGVVRGITNWGVFMLPRPLRVHQVQHYRGHYFIMRFDSSARTQHAVRRTIGLDPRMIRYSMVNMGFTLDAIKDVGGLAGWGSKPRDSDAAKQ